MPQMNTVRNSNGEIITGRIWRKSHSFFKDLPFYSDIAMMDDIASVMERDLGEGSFETLLIVSHPS
jgi:hypothetical protein